MAYKRKSRAKEITAGDDHFFLIFDPYDRMVAKVWTLDDAEFIMDCYDGLIKPEGQKA